MLETILVVENDKAVLGTVAKILQAADFRVLTAVDETDAIRLSEECTDRIDLLLSAVELSGTSGPNLGKALKKLRPDLHVMLMSGQQNGNLLVLNYGWAYIEKQALPAKLLRLVTDVLHTPDRSQLGDEFDSSKDHGQKAAKN